MQVDGPVTPWSLLVSSSYLASPFSIVPRAVSQLFFAFHLRPFLVIFGIVQVSWLSLFTFIPSLQLLLILKGVCLPLCPSYLSFSVQWALVEVDRFPTWLQNLLRVGRGNLTILEVDIQRKKLEGLKAIFDGGYCFKDTYDIRPREPWSRSLISSSLLGFFAFKTFSISPIEESHDLLDWSWFWYYWLLAAYNHLGFPPSLLLLHSLRNFNQYALRNLLIRHVSPLSADCLYLKHHSDLAGWLVL